MKLWSDEIDALRPEARAAVDAGMTAISAVYAASGPVPSDRYERAAEQRARMSASFVPVPEAVDTTIAGVRCRVFRPEGTARAVYLHLHGGGMIAGAPEMNDLGNRALSRRHQVAVVSVASSMALVQPSLAIARAWVAARRNFE